jgi:AraC family ethanolamine operon transcriptional activator
MIDIDAGRFVYPNGRDTDLDPVVAENLRITEACIEYADASDGHPTPAQMRAVAFASERRIRQAFAKTYGMPPTVYFRIRALHKVRLRLLSDDSRSSTTVAHDAGFYHPGRFAAHYREVFGELPSQTRANGPPSGGAFGDKKGSR